MRVALYSSKKPRCGIATYTDHLEIALRDLGVDVRHWPSLVNDAAVYQEVRDWGADVFHIQYEQAIMPSHDVLFRYAIERAKAGRKTVATLHSETGISAAVVRHGAVHATMIHRLPRMLSGAWVFPMPCPRFTPSGSREELRRRYGLPVHGFVLSTVGFLLPWKRTDDIVEKLLPWVARRTDVTVQVIASEHFNPGVAAYVRTCRERLQRFSAMVGGRIRHVDHYPPDQEVLDRLFLSDLGYVFCPFDTVSASAASSLFVSARCPLVCANSTHYEHMTDYTVRAPKEDLGAFARVVAETAENAELLERLRALNERVYADTNYLECARKHVKQLYA